MPDESIPSGALKVAELLPCPFCGSSAKWFKEGASHGVECREGADCPGRAQTNTYPRNHKQSAADDWNRRASPSPATGALSDQDIDNAVHKAGGRWSGDAWVIEDADLYPFVRTIADLSSAKREAEPLTQLECEMLPVWQDAAPWSGAGRLRIARAIEAAHGIAAS